MTKERSFGHSLRMTKGHSERSEESQQKEDPSDRVLRMTKSHSERSEESQQKEDPSDRVLRMTKVIQRVRSTRRIFYIRSSMDKKGYVYILTNFNNTTLYTGVTSNLIKRVWEHKNEVVEGFSKKYKTHKLVYFEVIDDMEMALNREKYIKGKSRQYKINLIEEMNKEWKDLYEDII